MVTAIIEMYKIHYPAFIWLYVFVAAYFVSLVFMIVFLNRERDFDIATIGITLLPFVFALGGSFTYASMKYGGGVDGAIEMFTFFFIGWDAIYFIPLMLYYIYYAFFKEMKIMSKLKKKNPADVATVENKDNKSQNKIQPDGF